MKKPTLTKMAVVVAFLIATVSSYSQNFVPFAPRFNQDIRGDMVLIGNNILGPNNSDYNNNGEYNHNVNMRYIDIDGDSSTFSSSSADLSMPNLNCYKIIYAGLYWGAVNPGNEPIRNVKIKGPVGGYHDVTGTVVYDAGSSSVDGGNSYPYSCYADVTSIVTSYGQGNDLGTYTVANVSSAQGQSGDYRPYNGTGESSGWSLLIVFEDPTMPGKSITTFDGFSSIVAASNPNLDVPVSGFRTIPTGPVRANFAFAALEGDKPISGDRLRLNGTTLSSPGRETSNFFNSSVTSAFSRQPSSSNTLGFDTGIIEVPNNGNAIIGNGDTSAMIRLESSQDTYFPYFFAFAVEIIEPDIMLTKIVEDDHGNNIGGETIGLGQSLNYVIGFQNIGNDHATNFKIRDVLPINIIYNHPTDLELPPGVTVDSYNPTTRELVFNVENWMVEEYDPVYEIRINVQVVDECGQLADACSNIVTNQAFATYNGYFNPNFQRTDDPSVSNNTGCLITPQATNFLADLDCQFTEDVILCGDSTVLTAAGGYDSYSWSTSPTGTPVIGTAQSLTVTETGTYYVHNTAIAPCQSIDQVFEVILYGANVANPIIPYADLVETCPNDGKELPKMFLCGANDTRNIETGITDATSMIWEILDETSCSAVANEKCANEDPGCAWNQVGTGPNFLVDTAGQYRLTLNYDGGCFNQFYFNVYSNLLEPTVTPRDIICSTPGEIVVNGVPSGYEYSINGVDFQESNIFSVDTPGFYSVYIRQTDVTPNPCIFSVPDVQIRERNFTMSSTVVQPLCFGDKGSVILAANDARPQYSFSIYSGVTLVNSTGLITENTHTFANLNPGNYRVEVSTEDGCVASEDIEIIEPDLLEVTATLTRPLTCESGEITIHPEGGTAPFNYYLNSTTDFETSPVFEITAPGVYEVLVVDYNGCEATTAITVEQIEAPDFSANPTDILCYNSNTGEIAFNVVDAHGYTVEYSIDGGVTYHSTPVFSNLGPGDYPTNIKYTLNGVECFSDSEIVPITQPDAAVTASAGVSGLAGCGPGGEGRVRITNPQGGTPPYEYSFDNQATWGTVNEANVMPGTYTLYIKDSNGCIYPMPGIVLEPEPVSPTITVSDPDYNCDGTAGTTVTVNNTGASGFTYTYYLNGVENPNTANPTTFLDVPAGSHTVTVEYRLATVPTYSNLLYETFGYGDDTSSPGINPAYYCFERQVVATQCNNNISINDGEYSVTSKIVSPFGSWMQPEDHTPATVPATPNGRFLVVNIGATIPATEILYEKEINDIIPNQPINVEFFAMNLLRSWNGEYNPNLTVALVDASGVEISSFDTGEIPKSEQWENYPKTPMTLDPGANTSLKFILRSNVQQTSGNDVAIDDIRVYQLPEVCTTKVEFPVVIQPGQEFSASVASETDATCSGALDGSVTISAQNFDTANGFQYSIDNGTTWTTSMSSPVTITGLGAGTYDIIVRYETGNPACDVPLQATIAQPDVLDLSVSITPPTCLDDAVITATGTGGTAPYSFELLDASTLSVAAAFPSNGILAGVTTGDYLIRVTDANGCTANTPVSINVPTPPTASIINADYCYDTTNGASLEVSASGGLAPYEYSINDGTTSSAFQSGNIFGNLAPGTYEITVRDANGCEVVLPAETIAPQVAVTTTLDKDLDCTVVSPEAMISGTISDGYAPYTVTLIQGSGTVNLTGNAFTLSTNTPGNYQFEVTDANGCTAVSNVIHIAPIDYPTATTTTVEPLCFGDGNGSVQIIASGGVGPYTYSFDEDPFETTSLYTGLTAGTYTYQVRDANECIFDGSVTLAEPTALLVNASATALSCAPDNTMQSATVTIDLPTTGTAPYTYSFNGSAFSATNTMEVHDNGTDQTITYSVRDANGCTASGSLTISALNPPTDLDFSATAVTCDDTTSEVTLTATNGVGALTYEIISPASAATSNTSGVFTGLAPDTYLFRVTDENGCYYDESLAIAPVTPIAVTGTKLSDVSCFGGNDGAARFSVSGFASTYSYTINGGAPVTGQSGSTIDLTSLSAGIQTIVVTDEATGCTATASITIDEPANAVGLTAVATNVFCNQFESQITATATGGTPNYTYAAVIAGSPAPADAAYTSSHIITVDTNSGADLDWDVYVKDANDCIANTSVTVVAEPMPTVTAPTVSNQCTVSSGFTFTVSATGVAPLSYSINGGASYQSSSTFTVNTPGSYTVTVRDANGCTATASTTTEVYPPIIARPDLIKDLTCSVPEEATIEITASGGNAPYTYEVSTDGGASYTAIPSSTYTTTAAGTYQFRITDTNGCDYETDVVNVTTAVPPVIASVTQTLDIACYGEETAAIDVVIDTNFGLAPYVIEVVNTDTGTNYGNQTSGLAAGNYEITVTDARGCEATRTILIGQPDAITIDYDVTPITCDISGTSLGAININSVSGGTPNYTYHVTGVNGYDEERIGQTGAAHFEVVDFGLYEIIVTDANGCMALVQNILVASPPTDLDIDIETTVNCSTGGEAEITVTTPLATGPFHFDIYRGTIPPPPPAGTWVSEDTPGSKTATFTSLLPGVTYTFIVYDEATGCYYYQTATTPVPTNSTLTIDALTSNNVTCVGSGDGNVSFTINSIYASPVGVDYQIFNSLSLVPIGPVVSATVPATGSLTVDDFGSLPFGNYYVSITETTGPYVDCGVVTVPFDITESAIPLALAATSTKNENCNELGVVTATASNGTAPYQYQAVATGGAPVDADWDTPNTFRLAAGTYDVYVRDAYGCVIFVTETVLADAAPTITAPAPQCFDGTPFTVTLSGTTFDGSATYNMNGGAYRASADFTISAAGTYTFTIQDANGCTDTTTYVVNPPLLLDADLTQDLTCAVDAEIDLTATGGSGTYVTYEVSTDGGTTFTAIGGAIYTTTTDGTYVFRVTDDAGCTALSGEIVVTPNTTPTLTYDAINVSCNGGADGRIIVTAGNGITPYEYRMDGGAWQTSNEFSGLSAGTYTIEVRDSKECGSASVDVTITEPAVVAASIDVTTTLSCDAANATQPAVVTVIGSDGTAPYTYSFDGINYTSTNTYETYHAGTVTAWVRDANGCVISTPVTVDVDALSVPTDLDFSATAVTCINLTSEVTLTETDGVGPLTYDILSPASATSNTTGATSGVFTDLAPDTYLFRVTDANGCYYTKAYTVTPVTNIGVSGTLVADVSCFGGNDGAVSFTVSDFASTYSYTINGGTLETGQSDATINLTGLSAGTQTIEVTDEVTGCKDTYTVTVSEPTLVVLAETVNINANCNMGAQVTVEASGGTAPYQYAFVVDSTTPTASDYTNSASAVLDPAISTEWDVWVMDDNGCTDQIDVSIATDPLPTFDVPPFAVNQCTVTTGFEFTVTNQQGEGPFTYSIGNGFQLSPTFTVATAGTYTVTIRDANGCTNAVPVTIEVYPVLDVSASVSTLPSCADDDGVITLTGTGGSGSYVYTISALSISNSAANEISGVPAGTYTVTIEDTVTGCTDTVDVTLDPPTPVSFTLAATDVSCNGGSDGVITVTLGPGNDNPVYLYSLDGGATTQTSNVFTGLSAGVYDVTVISGRNCQLTQQITVGEPTVITVPPSAITITEFLCAPGTNTEDFATITVSGVTGGSGNYTIYEFIKDGEGLQQRSSNNTFTETNLSGGTYTINVYDDNGCLGTGTATIAPFISIEDIDISIDNAITCTNGEDITVTVTLNPAMATANLEYTVQDVDGAEQTNNTGEFTNLPVGNYIITVANTDTGCSVQTTHYVNEPDTFDFDIDQVVDVTCYGGNDGSVTVTLIDRSPVPDDSGRFDYEVYHESDLVNSVASDTNVGPGPVTINGLEAGTYTIIGTLVNVPYCEVRTNFTITAPTAALDIDENHTEITCVAGYNDGTITVTASGGWPGGYEYQLEITGGSVVVPFGTDFNFTDLAAGDYTVSVRDSRGCIATENVILSIPPPVTITATPDVTLLACFGDTNATITAHASGGQGSNYTYTLNRILPTASSSGPQTSPEFNGLGAGTYSVTVTDGYNCTETSAEVTISEPAPLEADLVRSDYLTCDTDAELTLSATGGTAPYEYSDTSSFATATSFTTSVTIPVTAGTYEYYVRDSNGCAFVVSNEITIDPLPDLVVNLDISNATINCAGDVTGVIVAEAEGGLGNYVYTLQDASGNDIPTAVQNSLGVFTELPAGNYQVYVESDDCDATSIPVSITEPLAPFTATFDETDVTCAGENNGRLEITASGGTGIIKYAISPQLNQFFEEPVFEGLAPGTYQAIAQDELGCFVLYDFVINDAVPVMLTIVPNSLLPEVCSGDLNGMFSIEISGGNMPYSVSLDDYEGTYTTGAAAQTQFDFTGLAGGDHIVYVRDALGCESEWNITFPESVAINPVAEVVFDCVNNISTNTVTVSVDETVDPAELDYSLNGGPYQASNMFVDVPAGVDHYIDVRHTNGCIQRTPLFDVEQFEQLQLAIDDGEINQIVAVATGGAEPYEFTLNGEPYGSESTFTIYESGDYTVTVTDRNGCTASATRYFEYIDVCIPNYFVPQNGGWGPGCTGQYRNMTFDIFDRYGRKIATLNVDEKWDGKYNGKELPTGDYWYVVKLNDPNDDRDFVGHFTLYR